MNRYSQLRRTRPDLFTNVSGGVEILSASEDAANAVTNADGGPIGVLYEDSYIILIRDAVRFPDGRLGSYIRVLPSSDAPGVVILPLLDKSVVLIEHYRHATRAWHIEAPRGFGLSGQTGEASAARELREEMGVEPESLVALGGIHPDTGLLGHHVTLWAARIPDIGKLDSGEAIRRATLLSAVEAEDMVRSGEITDAFTIAALTRARLAGLLD